MRINTRELLIEKHIPPTVEIDNSLTREHWYNKKKELHGFNGQPAMIVYYKNGGVGLKRWFKNGKIHRGSNKPTSIFYRSNGTIECKEWITHGKFMKKKWY